MSCAPKLFVQTSGCSFSNGQGRINVEVKRGGNRFPVTYLDLAHMASTVREEYLENLSVERFIDLIKGFSFADGKVWPLSLSLRSILRAFGIENSGDVFDFLCLARAMVCVNDRVYGETGEGGDRTIRFVEAWLTAPEGGKSRVVTSGRFELKDRSLERRCPNWMVLAHTRMDIWKR